MILRYNPCISVDFAGVARPHMVSSEEGRYVALCDYTDAVTQSADTQALQREVLAIRALTIRERAEALARERELLQRIEALRRGLENVVTSQLLSTWTNRMYEGAKKVLAADDLKINKENT